MLMSSGSGGLFLLMSPPVPPVPPLLLPLLEIGLVVGRGNVVVDGEVVVVVVVGFEVVG